MAGEVSQKHHDVITWFWESQLTQIVRNGTVPEWFHGIISRKTSEEMLMPKPRGYFLIRVSESRIGYTLSYRAEDRCKHFMIDVLPDNQYVISGENTHHPSLHDLVAYHRRAPILPFTELLTIACGQESNEINYAELIFSESTAPSPGHERWSNTHPQIPAKPPLKFSEDTTQHKAAVPNLTTSNSQDPMKNPPSRLYPCIETELGAISLQGMGNSDKPVLVPRSTNASGQQSLDKPPQLPARIFTGQRKSETSNGTDRLILPSPGATDTPVILRNQHQDQDHHQHKIHQDKNLAVSALFQIKRKFQRKSTAPEEQHTYSEIVVKDDQTSASKISHPVTTYNEYQAPSGEFPVGKTRKSRVHDAVTDMSVHSSLPMEYLTPPPYAPGYKAN